MRYPILAVILAAGCGAQMTPADEQAALQEIDAAAYLAGSFAVADPASELHAVLVRPDLSAFIVTTEATYELGDKFVHVQPGHQKPGTLTISADFKETQAWFEQRSAAGNHAPRRSITITPYVVTGEPGQPHTYTFDFPSGKIHGGTLVPAGPVCETAADCSGVVGCAAPACASDHTCQCNQEIVPPGLQ